MLSSSSELPNPDGFEREVLDLMNTIGFERRIEEVVSDFIRKETLDINKAEDEKKSKRIA